MRPLLLFAVSFFLLVAFSFPALAQEWRVVESGVTTTLKDVMFVNKQTGWAGGDDSTLIKTTDGGATWFRQYPSVGGHVEAIWFLDEQRGYLIGGGITKGTGIYRTSDGGDTWEQYPEFGDFRDIQFVNQDTGWVIGYRYKRIWKTTDGGETWNEKGTGLLGVFKACSFLNGMEGWVAGAWSSFDNFEEEVIWHTTDGGETWEFQDEPNRTGPLNSIHVLPSGVGFAYGWGIGLRTLNRGEPWEPMGPGNLANALFALDEQNVYVARSDVPNFYLLFSSDTGRTWSQMSREDAAGTRGIFFLDPTFGFAVGVNGKIWRFDTTTVGVDNIPPQANTHVLSYVYPNPARASVTIEYVLGVRQNVRLAVYSLLGTEIAVLENGLREQGSHRVEFNAPAHLPSGLYFYELQTPQGTARGSMLLAK